MTTLLHRLFLSLLLVSVLATDANAEPFTSIAKIRELPPAEAARGLPVQLEALVTFHLPAGRSLTAYDGTEGIFVALGTGVSGDFAPGTRLRIEGVTEPGGFLPIIHADRISVLGKGSLPEPRRLNSGELYSPSLDCQWVQVAATITGVEEDAGIVLVAEISGWTVKLVVTPAPDSPERIAQILQRPVTIRGVVGSIFNAERQLTGRHFFVPSFDEITPSESSVPDGEPQWRAINELLRSDTTSKTRVRIRGTVTHATNHGFYLRGEGGSVLVRSANTGQLRPGSEVEAEGFPAVAPFRPIFRAATFHIVNQSTPPEPKPLQSTALALADQQGELVTADAVFLAKRDGPDGQLTLQCRSGTWFFEALLPPGAVFPARLEPEDVVRLSGICEVTSSGPLPFSGKVDGFRLHLRSPKDIAIIHAAPWWNLRRLLWALSTVGVLAVISLAWAALLRRRVQEQTEVISGQIQRAAVKDERQRIARELHDTIEQELAGVSMQLRNARLRLAQKPELASTSLALAERMLRHCREEARTSIRDLRSVALEHRGLQGALEEFLAPLAAECGARFRLQVCGTPRPLPGTAEVHLLRVAQEAVANAARHAQPQQIEVLLEYGENLVLEIRDDGCGFDPSAPAPRGHFGLLGIQERANKLNAILAIDSTAGAGTTVRVTLPTSVLQGLETQLS